MEAPLSVNSVPRYLEVPPADWLSTLWMRMRTIHRLDVQLI